ncbi:MAG TPA: D-alanine--D-alanine ligase family protein [Actinomycetota bacterium]|nr:D-alanine--D-alanine ligase family protein [Actinomycetota bacterium]
MSDPRRPRVLLIFGGRSAEHEVSVVSAASVAGALSPDRYEVVAVGIDKEGRWHLLPGPPALEPGGTEALPSVRGDAGFEVALAREPGSRELVGESGERQAFDVVFPVLHGPFGEDGTIQGLLELAGIPYVGAGVLASAVGMDKAVQKVLFQASGLPVVPHVVVHEREWLEDPEAVDAKAADLGYPVFVKPAALGSSVGITKVHELGELSGAMKHAFEYGQKALVERSMEGAREIEVSVLGNDDPVASLAGEIIPKGHEFYDYEAKYVDEDGAQLVVPADLSPETLEEAQRMAVTAFRAIDGAGMARVDFFLTPSGHLVVNEINTIPGFTRISMYPKLWEASGLSYAELVDRLVELALERHDAESKRGRTLGELPSPG